MKDENPSNWAFTFSEIKGSVERKENGKKILQKTFFLGRPDWNPK